mmetsp:Transcript_22565/g.45193  ORF Transcript_22565/g.45193 Transcript_22565/m.45193 type:complete len:230 (-) Transcript_22565:975-1664(-)
MSGPVVVEEAHVLGVFHPVLHVEGGEATHEELQLLKVEHRQERLRDHVKEPEHELRHLALGRVEERVAHPQVHEFVAVVASQIDVRAAGLQLDQFVALHQALLGDGKVDTDVLYLLFFQIEDLVHGLEDLVVHQLDVAKTDRPTEQVLVAVPHHVVGHDLAVEERLPEDPSHKPEVHEVVAGLQFPAHGVDVHHTLVGRVLGSHPQAKIRVEELLPDIEEPVLPDPPHV